MPGILPLRPNSIWKVWLWFTVVRRTRSPGMRPTRKGCVAAVPVRLLRSVLRSVGTGNTWLLVQPPMAGQLSPNLPVPVPAGVTTPAARKSRLVYCDAADDRSRARTACR